MVNGIDIAAPPFEGGDGEESGEEIAGATEGGEAFAAKEEHAEDEVEVTDFGEFGEEGDEAEGGDDRPAGEGGGFGVAEDGEDEGKGERLDEHFGHESLSVEDAERGGDEEEICPEGGLGIEEAPPDGLEEEKGDDPEENARQFSAEIEVAGDGVEADGEVVIDGDFLDVAEVGVAEPGDGGGEGETGLIDQATGGGGGLALAEGVGIDEGLIEGDATQRHAEEEEHPKGAGMNEAPHGWSRFLGACGEF